jgi:hypothetical protein
VKAPAAPIEAAEISLSEQRIVDLGKENWRTKKEGADWNGWVHVGQAIDVGRSHAMRVAHTNLPKGRPYVEAFGAWLKRNGFDDMDQVLRAALLECIGNLVEIEAWRKTLAANQRLEWNNPRTVLKRWRASHMVRPGKDAPAPSPTTALKARIVELETELHRLKQAGDGSSFSRKDKIADTAKVIEDEYHQQASKLRALASELIRRAKDIEEGK